MSYARILARKSARVNRGSWPFVGKVLIEPFKSIGVLGKWPKNGLREE
jgi:hypothetical protein